MQEWWEPKASLRSCTNIRLSTNTMSACLHLQLRVGSKKQEQHRERESGLVSAVAKLEKEKEALSRGLEMAQER